MHFSLLQLKGSTVSHVCLQPCNTHDHYTMVTAVLILFLKTDHSSIALFYFKLNTLRRLLEPQDAHWKYFVSFFLRVSHVRAGKLNLVLNITEITSSAALRPSIKNFFRPGLYTSSFDNVSIPPERLPDNLAEPLFQNELISIKPRAPYVAWLDVGRYHTN